MHYMYIMLKSVYSNIHRAERITYANEQSDQLSVCRVTCHITRRYLLYSNKISNQRLNNINLRYCLRQIQLDRHCLRMKTV